MKFNKWTLGLAAVGAVSLASAVRADEAPKMSQLQTALSNTTISGYVDVAAQYNINHTANGSQPAFVGSPNSFSLNDVDIAIDKPEDDTPWASGYHIDFNVGNQAVGDGAIRQGYVVLRTPVGNGIDWKFGVQDDIIGYEGNTDGNNPNYTRSIGYDIEPTTLTGLIGSYTINKMITVQGGIANATSGGFSSEFDGVSPSSKVIAGAVALTAPDSWGWIKGATLNLGGLWNVEKNGVNNYYAGVTVPTPMSALKVGASFDYISVADNDGFKSFFGNSRDDTGYVVGLYGNYQATDKLAVNLRGEFYNLQGRGGDEAPFDDFAPPVNPYADTDANGIGEEVTATVQYNLWANVISRLEFRWDHSDAGTAFGVNEDEDSGRSTPQVNSFILALNLIYQF